MPVVIGTAGHIDHGKTSLVKALTGVDTDRLPIEKQRGITTELGFAPFANASMIDVPGHERFVKSMVAGATGIDLVLLVIAADEGVMPQTREHIAICDLLGIERGVIALTKRDLVDDDTLALAIDDVTSAIAGTSFATMPIVPTSIHDVTAVRAALETLIATTPARADSGVFRLAIDRVFTKKGFGTIVTGTILGGEVAVGDELSVIPSNLTARVRGLESHGATVQRAGAGMRCAINLGGVAVDELARGDVLVHPGQVLGSHILDVKLRALAEIPVRSKVLLHHGTTQVLASLQRLDEDHAQLRVDRETPLAALPGDHFIVRGFVTSAQHGSTIGGGTVVRVLAPKARRSHAEDIATIARAKLDQRTAFEVKAAASAGLDVAELVQRVGVAELPLADLVVRGELALYGERFLHAETVATLERTIIENVGAERSREELRTSLPAALATRTFDTILESLVGRDLLAVDGERMSRTNIKVAANPLDQQVLAKLLATGLEPPRPKELAGAMGLADAAVQPALARLVAGKLAVKIKPDLIMHADVVADIRGRLVAYFQSHPTIDAAGWKQLTQASRKFTIPLAEFFDAEKLTLRIGDIRRLRRRRAEGGAAS